MNITAMTDLNLHVESALQHVYEVCMGWSALFPGPPACGNARAQGRAWERGYGIAAMFCTHSVCSRVFSKTKPDLITAIIITVQGV